MSDEAIARALRALGDPELIGALRRLLGRGLGDSATAPDTPRSVEPDAALRRFLGRAPGNSPLVSAATLMLAAVPGLAPEQPGRGLRTSAARGPDGSGVTITTLPGPSGPRLNIQISES